MKCIRDKTNARIKWCWCILRDGVTSIAREEVPRVYNRRKERYKRERRNAATSHLRDVKCSCNITSRELVDKLDNANCKQNILPRKSRCFTWRVLRSESFPRRLRLENAETQMRKLSIVTTMRTDFTASRTALHFSRNKRNAPYASVIPLSRTERDRVRSQILSRYERFPREPEPHLRLRTFRHSESCRPRHEGWHRFEISRTAMSSHSYGTQKHVSLTFRRISRCHNEKCIAIFCIC